jgi:hypothetical protein
MTRLIGRGALAFSLALGQAAPLQVAIKTRAVIDVRQGVAIPPGERRLTTPLLLPRWCPR